MTRGETDIIRDLIADFQDLSRNFDALEQGIRQQDESIHLWDLSFRFLQGGGNDTDRKTDA